MQLPFRIPSVELRLASELLKLAMQCVPGGVIQHENEVDLSNKKLIWPVIRHSHTYRICIPATHRDVPVVELNQLSHQVAVSKPLLVWNLAVS